MIKCPNCGSVDLIYLPSNYKENAKSHFKCYRCETTFDTTSEGGYKIIKKGKDILI